MSACAAPLEPRGYIGWAASPMKVTRPKVQRGTGSLSTIGYSRIVSASPMSRGTSSQSKRQSAYVGRKSSMRPGRFQSFSFSPGMRRLAQHPMELSAVDAQLRMRVPRAQPARFAVDELAEAVEEEALGILDRHRAQLLLESQGLQLAHPVGQERDAHAQLAKAARA